MPMDACYILIYLREMLKRKIEWLLLESNSWKCNFDRVLCVMLYDSVVDKYTFRKLNIS